MKQPHFSMKKEPFKTLRDFFDRSGYTRQEAAERWGVTEATICRWISGSRQPSAEQMLTIEADTGVPLRALVRTAALRKEAA
jgi:transcriptional regulator with XRE-family HTH domain